MAKIVNICQKLGVILMATMNISLPDPMKDWVESQVGTRYSNVSDYVRDLIRKEQDRSAKILALQAKVTEGLASGSGTRSMEELRNIARQQITSEE